MTNNPPKETRVLDASGLLCPKVLLEAKLALQKLGSGEILKVISTDPSSEIDIGVFVRQTPHRLHFKDKKGMNFYYWIEKA